MVVTVVPQDEIDEPLDLRNYVDALGHHARQIRGTSSASWGTSGLKFSSPHGEHPSLLIHRSGRIEFCEPDLIMDGRVVSIRVLLPLIGSVETARRLARDVGLAGPLQVDVSLVGVEGSQFHTPPRKGFHGSYGFDLDTVHQRWVIEVEDCRSDTALRPLANVLWQSSGFEECHYYDGDDRWLQWDEYFE